MTSMTADEALKAYLTPIKERTEIRTAQGELLGVFAPACDLLSEAEKKRYEELSKLFDPEEIKRRKERAASRPVYTIEQVREKLRALELEEQRRLAEGAGARGGASPGPSPRSMTWRRFGWSIRTGRP